MIDDIGVEETKKNFGNVEDTVGVFMNSGMGCLGCAAAHFENIEQGALAHGIDVNALMKDLNVVADAAAAN